MNELPNTTRRIEVYVRPRTAYYIVEVAIILGIPYAAAARLVAEGRLMSSPCADRAGRRVLHNDLLAFVRRHKLPMPGLELSPPEPPPDAPPRHAIRVPRRPEVHEEMRQPIYTAAQAARLLGLPAETVAGWIRHGIIGCAHKGTVSRSALLAYAEKRGLPAPPRS